LLESVEASISAHGGGKRWDVVNTRNIDGSAFIVKYFQGTKVFGTHALDITGDSGGGKSPLIQNELLPGPPPTP
jgi:type IV secretory pathway VirB4 component